TRWWWSRPESARSGPRPSLFAVLGAVAEDRRADSDMGGADADGDLIIAAHPHGKHRQVVPLGEFREKRKMRRRRLVHRRDAHEPLHRQAELVAAERHEAVHLLRRHAGLLRFLAGID